MICHCNTIRNLGPRVERIAISYTGRFDPTAHHEHIVVAYTEDVPAPRGALSDDTLRTLKMESSSEISSGNLPTC